MRAVLCRYTKCGRTLTRTRPDGRYCWSCGGNAEAHLSEGRGDCLEAVAGAEVGAEGADGGERIEERLRRGLAVVGEGDVEAAGGGGERGEEVLAQVAAAPHDQHPLPILLLRHLSPPLLLCDG